MVFWHKPATLSFSLSEELEIIHVADVFKPVFYQFLYFTGCFCHFADELIIILAVHQLCIQQRVLDVSMSQQPQT
jgi:hypothetical protein